MGLSVRVPGECWPRRCSAGVAAYVEQFADQRDDNGYRLVVGNGYHLSRGVLAAAGAVQVAALRVNDGGVDPDSGNVGGFARRSCRRGCARHRRWPRCCRCCTSMVC